MCTQGPACKPSYSSDLPVSQVTHTHTTTHTRAHTHPCGPHNLCISGCYTTKHTHIHTHKHTHTRTHLWASPLLHQRLPTQRPLQVPCIGLGLLRGCFAVESNAVTLPPAPLLLQMDPACCLNLRSDWGGVSVLSLSCPPRGGWWQGLLRSAWKKRNVCMCACVRVHMCV